MKIPTSHQKPAIKLPGEWLPPAIEFSEKENPKSPKRFTGGTLLRPDLFDDNECVSLIRAMKKSGQEAPVGVTGYSSKTSGFGSVRATAWAPDLADKFWSRFKFLFSGVRSMDDFTPTDWYRLGERQEHKKWKAIGVSPVLRFMKYESGGEHYGHYDMGYDYGDGRRTLVSFVVYLTTIEASKGGRTRFLKDGQEDLPIWKRNHSDWSRRAVDAEVKQTITPSAGAVLFFDHRICHDVELYSGQSPRIIIRGDIIYWAQ